MNTDIRIAVSFKGHRKRKKLKNILGPGSTDYLLDLWIGTAVNRPEGILHGYDETDIALEAGWEGDPQEFVNALMQVGFLERNGDGIYVLHSWEEHNPYASRSKERSEQARRAINIRWEREKHSDSIRNEYEPNTEGNTERNTPKPNPKPKPEENTTGVVTPVVPENGNEIQDKPKIPPCPHGKIIELYHAILPEFPRVDEWDDDRQSFLRSRWKAKSERQSLDWWGGFFEQVRTYPWLMGDNPKGWMPNLEWLVRPRNFRKVNEGFYKSRASPLKAKYGEKGIKTAMNVQGWKPKDIPP